MDSGAGSQASGGASASGGTGGQGPEAGGGPTDGQSGGSPGAGGGSTGGSSTGGSSTGGSSTGGETACSPDVSCQLTAGPSTGDVRQDCVDRINQFRRECLCLPDLQRWTEAEACADQQAAYDSTNGFHEGFKDGICMPSGSAQNECPGWGSEAQVVSGCLQMMWDEGPPPTQPCNGQCFQDHGHFINMSSEGFSRVACGFFTTPEGDVWAVQNFGD